MSKFERYLTVAGFTILAAFTAALLMPLRFDSGLRGLKAGAIAATFSLEILWFVLGVIVAFKQWRSTTASFRTVLTLNGLAFVLIVVETVRELSVG
jgi:hypothetical protein